MTDIKTLNDNLRKHLIGGKIVFNNNWAWIVVFQAINKRNYAIVKYDNGKYTVIEM